VELRLHTTTLYNSIYRLDGDLLVNTHAYGFPAAQSPVLHLRRLAGGSLFDHYQASFERVWAQARPVAALAGTGSTDGRALTTTTILTRPRPTAWSRR
jgi:hypothetical protein